MNVFNEFSKLLIKLQDEKDLKYALVGGVAVAFHDHFRYTKDIDLLITDEGLEKISRLLRKSGYAERALPWTFSDSGIVLHRFIKFEGEEHMIVDVMIGQTPRHEAIIANAVEAQSVDGIVKIASREDLIWMKSMRNSDTDQLDIKKLRDGKI